MHKKVVSTLIAVVAILSLSVSALAETTAEDAYDYREAIMTTLKGHLLAASMILRGKAGDFGALDEHAQAMANSAQELPHIFQLGSNVEGSEALPKIWEETEGFQAALNDVISATEVFAMVTAGADREAMGDAFRAVGQSCRGCHDNYRKPKD